MLLCVRVVDEEHFLGVYTAYIRPKSVECAAQAEPGEHRVGYDDPGPRIALAELNRIIHVGVRAEAIERHGSQLLVPRKKFQRKIPLQNAPIQMLSAFLGSDLLELQITCPQH